MSIWSAIKSVLPIKFADDAEKVAPAVQAAISKIIADAQDEVDKLRKLHSVQTLKDNVAKDLADLDWFVVRIKKAILDAHTAQVAAAQVVLPPLVLPVTPINPAPPAA